MLIENYIDKINTQLSKSVEQVESMKDTFDLVESLGGFTYTVTQSDKLGFDWRNTVLNDVIICKEYVEQATPVGTSADNPIMYEDGVPLINNAFYNVNGSIKVWMEKWVDWNTQK